MTVTTKPSAVKSSAFDKALESESLQADEGNNTPFLDLFEKAGNFAIVDVTGLREVSYKMKKGKNKGKDMESTYLDVIIVRSNIADADEGSLFTISCSGLLKWQMTKGLQKHNLSLPVRVGIEYKGKDEEGRHQTTVAYPKGR